MENERKRPDRIRIEQHSFGGLLWFGAWLFTLGFLHPGLGKGLLALLLWPYYLGEVLRGLHP